MKIYSTQKIGGSKELNISVISGHLKSCTSCTIITAYYSLKFFEELCKYFEKQRLTRFTLVVSFQSKLLTESGKDEIKLIKEKLLKIAENIDIRINEKYPIMHSKIYRFRTDLDKIQSTYLIGSANASNAAFNVNEEVLLEVGSSKTISAYCKALVKDSTDLKTFLSETSCHKSNNLVSFFKQGFLFVKYPYAISLRYQPDSLKKILKQDSGVLGFEPGELFGGFNLENYYKIEPNKRGEQLRKYSLQTNLGLWLPAFYYDHIIDKLDGKKEKKGGYYKELLDKMRSSKSDEIFDQISYTIKEYFYKISDVKRRESFESWANSTQKSNFKEWFSCVSKKIENVSQKQNYCGKLTQQYYLGGDVYYLSPMPSIWSDESESQEFKDYFFDSVDMFGGGNGRKASSRVAESIKNKFKFKSENLEKILKEKGWTTDDWIKPDADEQE